jgi:hypothetical protein
MKLIIVKNDTITIGYGGGDCTSWGDGHGRGYGNGMLHKLIGHYEID